MPASASNTHVEGQTNWFAYSAHGIVEPIVAHVLAADDQKQDVLKLRHVLRLSSTVHAGV